MPTLSQATAKLTERPGVTPDVAASASSQSAVAPFNSGPAVVLGEHGRRGTLRRSRATAAAAAAGTPKAKTRGCCGRGGEGLVWLVCLACVALTLCGAALQKTNVATGGVASGAASRRDFESREKQFPRSPIPPTSPTPSSNAPRAAKNVEGVEETVEETANRNVRGGGRGGGKGAEGKKEGSGNAGSSIELSVRLSGEKGGLDGSGAGGGELARESTAARNEQAVRGGASGWDSIKGNGKGEDGSPYDLSRFPSLEESTVMFLHVFKCAGSTLRRMLVEWAEEEGKSGAIVVKCDDLEENGEVCLSHYELLDEAVQREHMARQKVLAGHFLWGFQRHVDTPYLMITALRNPLELFVSAQQYINRKETKTLEEASDFVSSVMRRTLRRGGPGAPRGTWKKGPTDHGLPTTVPGQVTGFIRRFVGVDRKTLHGERLEAATTEALQNLETMWVVGVVEQYAGFEQVLRRLLDPHGQHMAMWEKYATTRYNKSPIKSTDVLATIDPELVQRFNGSLALQWSLYEKAVDLWDVRCRHVLPSQKHSELCTVPLPPRSYS